LCKEVGTPSGGCSIYKGGGGTELRKNTIVRVN
jgi:hypothetical protein